YAPRPRHAPSPPRGAGEAGGVPVDRARRLGLATVERTGRVGQLELRNPRFLNAEDDAATAALEIGADLVLLDPGCEVGVLRGAVVDHPRHAGRRVFNAGINLTHLYHGRI